MRSTHGAAKMNREMSEVSWASSMSEEESLLAQLQALHQQLALLRETAPEAAPSAGHAGSIIIASANHPVRLQQAADGGFSLVPSQGAFRSAVDPLAAALSRPPSQPVVRAPTVTAAPPFPQASPATSTIGLTPAYSPSTGGGQQHQPSAAASASGVASVSATAAGGPVTWVTHMGTWVRDSQQAQVRDKLQSEFNTVPVFLTEQQCNAYQADYCSGSLWPVLHSQPMRVGQLESLASGWEAYQQANAAYADVITSMSNPPLKDGDIIIVHDFHLLLLPKLLRARLQGKEVTIVMALESPFPAAELFRCLPTRLDLLSGMLGADLIVLHDFSFARHLCNAATQLLGLESNPKSIEIGDRHVALAVLPLGIDVTAFQLQHNDDVMNERRNMAKDLISGTMVVGTAQQALQDAAQPMQAVMMGAGGGMMRARSQTGGFGEGTATDGGSITTIAQQQPSVAPTGPGEQMRLIVSVDRLDPVKGIPLKLLAFEDLLESHPEYKNNTAFIYLLTTSDSGGEVSPGPALSDLNLKVSELAGRINGRFGSPTWAPLRVLRTPLPRNQLLALYSLADVGVFTSLRDGITHPAFEFVASQLNPEPSVASALHQRHSDDDHDHEHDQQQPQQLHARDRTMSEASEGTAAATEGHQAHSEPSSSDVHFAGLGDRGPGVMIYSEFSGCHGSLHDSGAITVNPFNTRAVAEALHAALTLAPKTRSLRHSRLMTWLRYNSAPSWARRVLDASRAAATSAAEYRVLGRLDLQHVLSSYASIGMGVGSSPRSAAAAGAKRLIVSSYNGTLVPYKSVPELCAPSARVRLALARLASDPRNVVWLVTGDIPQQTLHIWFGDLPIGLAAYHGYRYRFPPDSLLASQVAAAMIPQLEADVAAEEGSKASGGEIGPLQRHMRYLTNAQSQQQQQMQLDSIPSKAVTSSEVAVPSSAALSVQWKPPSPDEWLQAGMPSTGDARPLGAGTDAEATGSTSIHGVVGERAVGPATEQLDLSWYPEVADIMRYFTERTPGAVLNEFEACLLWSYELADPDFGPHQARDLLLHLQNMLFSAQAEVLFAHNKTFIFVRPLGLSKGSLLAKLLASPEYNHGLKPATAAAQPMAVPGREQHAAPQQPQQQQQQQPYFDFMLCLGDERTDEDLYPHARSFPPGRGFAVTVGRKPTQAQYYVDSPATVLQLLESLSLGQLQQQQQTAPAMMVSAAPVAQLQQPIQAVGGSAGVMAASAKSGFISATEQQQQQQAQSATSGAGGKVGARSFLPTA